MLILLWKSGSTGLEKEQSISRFQEYMALLFQPFLSIQVSYIAYQPLMSFDEWLLLFVYFNYSDFVVAQNDGPSPKNGNGVSKGIVAGIVVGAICFIVLILGVLWFWGYLRGKDNTMERGIYNFTCQPLIFKGVFRFALWNSLIIATCM